MVKLKNGFHLKDLERIFSLREYKQKTMHKNGIIFEYWTTVNNEISQETVLEPLIFKLYINVFSEKMKSVEDLQFSHDTCI